MAYVFRGAADGEIVQQDNSVLDYGNHRRHPVCTVLIEHGRRVYYVIDIPLSRLAHCVGKRDNLLVHASGLAVGVGLVLVAVQDLYLIFVLKIYAAVASGLAVAGNPFGNAPFQVELETSETLFGKDIAGSLVHGEDAVVDWPSCLSAPGGYPGIQVLAVEQYNRIGRGGIGNDVTGGDYYGLRRPELSHPGSHRLRLGVFFLLGECGSGKEQRQGDGK